MARAQVLARQSVIVCMLVTVLNSECASLEEKTVWLTSCPATSSTIDHVRRRHVTPCLKVNTNHFIDTPASLQSMALSVIITVARYMFV